ncbi:MAG: NADH-quinone oxidoreductase subunit M [Bacteroidota bacterium]
MNAETLTLLLSISIFAPLVGAILLPLFQDSAAKVISLIFMLIPLGLSLGAMIMLGLDPNAMELATNGYFGFTELSWFGMSGYDVKYMVGVDGISAFMILLAALLFPLMAIYTWGTIKKQEKMFYIMVLLLETGVIGFFASLDMMLFYIFFELVLIPTSFLIGIWGDENRGAAALKFFIYTLVGSLVMLIAIIYMGINAGVTQGFELTTDYFLIQEAIKSGTLPSFTEDIQWWLFLGFAISFAIKAPVFPVHTWQAQAYTSSSTTGSVILAALLSKMGAYGFLRFCLPLFPAVVDDFAPMMAILGVISIIYGAYMATVQKDLKKLVAYSSLSHMGFIILGIFAVQQVSVSGAVLQMLAHGVSTAALFIMVDMMEQRYGSKNIEDFKGLAKQAPAFTTLFMITVMASVGLPGLSGFVGEFMIMTGAFSSSLFGSGLTVFAATGVVLAAIYLLNMFRKVMFGPESNEAATFNEPNRREYSVMLPMVILMFWLGLYATPFLKPINQGTKQLIEQQAEMPESLSVVEEK